MTRLFLIIVLMLSASLAGAAELGHVDMGDREHFAIESIDTEHSVCCEIGSERTHSCLTMPAMFEGMSAHSDVLDSACPAFGASGRILTGIQPSDPLGPPRLL